MVGVDADVLVHVEADHARPVDAVVEHERVEKVELRVAGGEHRVRDATRRDRIAQDRGRVLRGSRAERVRIGKTRTRSASTTMSLGHQTDANCGSQAFVAASISSVISPTWS